MKAVIFDFDGVIHDTLQLGHDVNNKLHTDMSMEDYKDIFNGNIYAHKRVLMEDQDLFFLLSGPEYEKLEIEEHIKTDLLKLKEKYLLFIISSNSEKIMHKYFEKNKSSNIFKEMLGVETHTSKTEKFKMLFNKYILTKDDCIFITDTLGDILEANRLGIDTIAVDFGFHERERLMKGSPKKIVSHFDEILPAIEEISKSRPVPKPK